MRSPYTRPRVIPRTERHLWPREARLLDAWWECTAWGESQCTRFNALFAGRMGSRRGLPTEDEQNNRIRQQEIEDLWSRRG